VLSQIAKVLGKDGDAKAYLELAKKIGDAFNATWLNPSTNQYATGSQTANLFPLTLGLVPTVCEQWVLKNALRTITEKHAGHLHTGNTGTTCLVDLLTDQGHGEVLYDVVNKTTYPGWGYMVAQGATTIWEVWGLSNGAESMVMWLTVDEFFYNDIAGIRGPEYHAPGMMVPGFEEIDIKPHVLGDLTHASASMRTVRGLVSSSWKRKAKALTLKVSIPVNARARVSVPKIGLKNVRVTEGGSPVWEAGTLVQGVAGITGGREESDHVTFEVGSGSYTFQLRGM
jgi:alpha-L-rhamnosidase